MEGYKSFIQVMDDASDHCSKWVNIDEGTEVSYDDMMEAAVFTDGLMPLPDNQWWMAFDDGTVGLLDENTKEIWVMYRPVKSPPVKEKYTGDKLDKKLRDFMPPGTYATEVKQNTETPDSAPAFCIYCGAKLPAGAAFCPKCGKAVKEG